MATKKPEALAIVLARQVGFRNSMKVLTFITAWGIVYESLGRAPSVEEYADWWKESYPTAYREQKLFREAMPGQDTPTELWEQVRAQVRGKSKKDKDMVAAKLATMQIAVA
jgi:hypothetical protein